MYAYDLYMDLTTEFPQGNREWLLTASRAIVRGGDRQAWLNWALRNGAYPER